MSYCRHYSDEAWPLEERVQIARQQRLEAGCHRLIRLGAGRLVEFMNARSASVASALLDQAMAALACRDEDGVIVDLTPEVVAPLVVHTRLGTPLLGRCPRLSTRDISQDEKPSVFARKMVPAPDLEEQLSAALEEIARLGEFGFIEDVFGVLVVTDPQTTEPIAHGTSSKLIGTIYSTPLNKRWRFGEMLVHEAAHSWLYECARAVGEGFQSGAMFVSPWKQRERPLAMFLQAVFAFAAVARYHQLLLLHGLVGSADRASICKRLSSGLEQLERAASSLDDAVALVDEPLRPLIVTRFRSVRAQGPVAG